MGIGLKFLPVKKSSVGDGAYTNQVITAFDGIGNDLLHRIKAVELKKGLAMPNNFVLYALGKESVAITENPYGEPVFSLKAKHLVKFQSHDDVVSSPNGYAAWAWLKAVHPETEIALYWD